MSEENIEETSKRPRLSDVIREVFPDTYAIIDKMITNGDAVDFHLEIIEPMYDKSNINPHVNMTIFFLISDQDGDLEQKFKYVRYNSGRDMHSLSPEDLNKFILDCLEDYVIQINSGALGNENNSDARNSDQTNGDDSAISQVQRANSGL